MIFFTIVGVLFSISFLVVLFYAGYKYLTGNVHVLSGGNFIRSGQLNKKQLERVLRKHKPKVVISLRGEAHFRTGKEKGQPERAVIESHGIRYITIDMSSARFPYPEDLNKLIDIYLDLGNYPMYIHCLGGSDRTGEASAIYQMIINRKTKEEALKQLTFKYLHLRSVKPAKSYFIQEWEGIDWARNRYRRFE